MCWSEGKGSVVALFNDEKSKGLRDFGEVNIALFCPRQNGFKVVDLAFDFKVVKPFGGAAKFDGNFEIPSKPLGKVGKVVPHILGCFKSVDLGFSSGALLQRNGVGGKEDHRLG